MAGWLPPSPITALAAFAVAVVVPTIAGPLAAVAEIALTVLEAAVVFATMAAPLLAVAEIALGPDVV